MKKIAALLFTVIAVAGCYKDEITQLQDDIASLKNTEIASLKQQVDKMSSSVKDIETLRSEVNGFITSLEKAKKELTEKIEGNTQKISSFESGIKGQIDAAKSDVLAQVNSLESAVNSQIGQINKTIESLKEKDAELERAISTLTGVSGDIASKDWVSGTFATLEKQNEIITDVEGIKAQIGNLTKGITDLETRLNDKIAKDIATAAGRIDGDIAAKAADITTAYTEAIGAAKKDITTAYTEAIQKAISDSESSIKEWINSQLKGYYTIAETDAKIKTAKEDVERQLSEQKTYLEGLINGLKTCIDTDVINMNNAITELQAKDGELSNKVAENAKKITDFVGQYTKDTTATGQHLAMIDTAIDEIRGLIASTSGSSVENAAALMEKILDNALAIADNLRLIQANQTAISNNAALIAQNAEDILKLKNDLAQQKTDITTAYQAAISEAITSLEGKINEKIAGKISEVEGKLTSAVEAINSKIDDLQAQINSINEDIKTIKDSLVSAQSRIATITGQINGINNSITKLEQMDKTIMGLINELDAEAYKTADEAIKAEIKTFTTELKRADTTLNKRIDTLKAYVGTLPAGTTETNVVDWVKASIATLAKQADVAASIEGIRTLIGEKYDDLSGKITKMGGDISALDSKISEMKTSLQGQISTLESTLKTWVNSQLTGYYTIAQIDAKLATINSTLSSLGSKDTNLQNQITSLSSALETAKTSIKTAYEKAISDAIKANDGYVTTTIKNAITQANSKISTLTSDVNTLKSDVSDLKRRMTSAENNISTIQGQINNINKSISDLQTIDAQIRAYIDEIKSSYDETLGTYTTLIGQLQTKDTELQGQITALKNFVGTLPTGATQTNVVDWAKGTFATLAQQQATAATVGGIQTTVSTLSSALNALNSTVTDNKTDIESKLATAQSALQASISSTEASLKTWVNSQLTGYYTIAQIDSKLAAIKDINDALTDSVNSLGIKDTELETRISEVDSKLDAAKSTIKTAYEKAINDAITANDGYVTLTIKAAIASSNSRIAALESSVSTIQSNLAALTNRVAKNEMDIASLQGRVLNLETKVGNVTGSKSLAELISALADELNALKNGSDKTIKQLEESIAALTGRVSDLELIVARVSALENAVGALQNQVGNYSGEEFNNLIAGLREDLNNLGGGNTMTVKQIEEALAALEARMLAATTNSINSISYVPAYDDGKAWISEGCVELDFIVSPKTAVTALSNLYSTDPSILKVIGKTVMTKAQIDFIDLGTVASAEFYPETGQVTVKADINSLENGIVNQGRTYCVALTIGSGSDPSGLTATSSFVPVAVGNIVPVTSVAIVTESGFSDGSVLRKRNGNVGKLRAKVNNDNGFTFGRVNWTSSDPSVATVTATGNTVTVTPKAKGTTTITASVSGQTATQSIRVYVPVTSLSLSPSPLHVIQGSNVIKKVTAILGQDEGPSDVQTADFTFNYDPQMDHIFGSADGNVYTVIPVEEDVTPTGSNFYYPYAGTYSLKATADGINATCDVIVHQITTLERSQIKVGGNTTTTSDRLAKGSRITLYAVIPDSLKDFVAEEDIIWSPGHNGNLSKGTGSVVEFWHSNTTSVSEVNVSFKIGQVEKSTIVLCKK